MSQHASEHAAPPPAEPGVELVDGKRYMRDVRGALLPIELVKPADLLADQLVRRLTAKAEALRATIAAFREECFDEVAAHQALVDEKYGVKIGGQKGNTSLLTVDGTQRLQVAIAAIQNFGGAELQAAKSLIDECLTEWSAESGPELRRIVLDAFQVDQEGRLNRSRIFGLLRLDIADPRWMRAMDAIRDSIRVEGSRQYVRFHKRTDTRLESWTAIPLDAATA